MHGRTLATIENVVCHYTPDSDKPLDILESWVNRQESIELELVPIEEHVTEENFDREEETLGVTLGGDGAFLEGVREFSQYDIPLLGVNTGTLAFLARVSPSDLEDSLDEILQGRAEVASRQRVEVKGSGLDAEGVNDVMIQPIPPEDPVERKIASVEVYVDNEYVGEYTGSGLAVSTPTGSTGISLSANGPIHYPSNNLSLQIIPLHTHKMGVRPVIVSSESEVTVVPKNEVQVMVDGGRHNTVAVEGEELVLTGADSRADIVRTSFDDEFFTAMTKKLGWGLREPEEDGSYDVLNSASGGTDTYQRARDVAVEASKSAGEKLREIHGNVENVEYKTDKSDMVTEADYQADKIIQTTLKNEFPRHDVLSEEEWVDKESHDEFEWLIDPLDGTGNFMHGNPSYSISIALLRDGEPVVGVVYQPETDEVFHAIKDRGAFSDDHRISVSDSDSIDESMMLSGYDPDGDFIETFYGETQGVRAVGSAALNLCYIASGAADTVWEYDTYPWDVAAGLLILKEAGGTATDENCNEYSLEFDVDKTNRMVASNGIIHTQVCSKIVDSSILND